MTDNINRVSELLMKRYNSFRAAQKSIQKVFEGLHGTPYIMKTTYQYAYEKGRADATLDAIRELRRENAGNIETQ